MIDYFVDLFCPSSSGGALSLGAGGKIPFYFIKGYGVM